MVPNSRSTLARIGATALLNATCHGLSGRLRRALCMIRGSIPRARSPARRASLSYALSAYTAASSPWTRSSSGDAVVDVRGRHPRLTHQPAALVDRGVGLVAEPAPA